MEHSGNSTISTWKVPQKGLALECGDGQRLQESRSPGDTHTRGSASAADTAGTGARARFDNPRLHSFLRLAAGARSSAEPLS